jgi:nitrite reductase/ring-hydroxylating ferredoxin subunit
MKYWSKKICLLVVVLLFVSCGDRVVNDIPYTKVNFTRSIYATNLIHTGMCEYFSGGISGIVVYRLDMSIFYAYDRACPHDWRDNGYLIYDPATLKLVCQNCGSMFDILSGAPTNNSKAKTFLRPYNARLIDDMTLHVYN